MEIRAVDQSSPAQMQITLKITGLPLVTLTQVSGRTATPVDFVVTW